MPPGGSLEDNPATVGLSGRTQGSSIYLPNPPPTQAARAIECDAPFGAWGTNTGRASRVGSRAARPSPRGAAGDTAGTWTVATTARRCVTAARSCARRRPMHPLCRVRGVVQAGAPEWATARSNAVFPLESNISMARWYGRSGGRVYHAAGRIKPERSVEAAAPVPFRPADSWFTARRIPSPHPKPPGLRRSGRTGAGRFAWRDR
jgi:hypothetical protein